MAGDFSYNASTANDNEINIVATSEHKTITDFSVSLWAEEVGEITSSSQVVFLQHTNGGGAATQRIVIYFADGGAGDDFRSYSYRDGGSGGVARSPAGSAGGAGWRHYVITRDNSGPTYTIYIDGESQSVTYSALNSGDIIISADDITIGSFGDLNGTLDSEGYIDDVRYYTRILTGNEIQTLYSSKGKDNIVDSLVGRWTMSEAASGTMSGTGQIKDLTGVTTGGTAQGTNKPSFILGPLIKIR